VGTYFPALAFISSIRLGDFFLSLLLGSEVSDSSSVLAPVHRSTLQSTPLLFEPDYSGHVPSALSVRSQLSVCSGQHFPVTDFS
jgi:hypothetical protein